MSVEDPTTIDFVAYDQTGVVLVIVEGREWDGSPERLFQLQEKINSYVSFVLDGQLRERYPELARKSVCVELRCVNAPDPETANFLEMARQRLREEGIDFLVKEIRTEPSG